MKQQTLVSLWCFGLGVFIQINCYLSFHRLLMVPICISVGLFICGLLLFERRNQ